ncbi:hypothetical protein BAUCODRAFT_563207 [Baudoinia panamericana UAMH 10762]|uniref:Uncharacterized protein n=1 Tax=Baudoinia panamericana (strain UAMH 10762) TaxID=717646 RepID=M2N6V9_BAUPA|nr:uncharacterized protein BAUCODRAFT_563207 [Baudoinia panamericana UAMH 10762]EMC94824.1 hypothetical protein BAUCODRAFT_563207 [Baudoinia panamericana UAMH 10762]
MQWLHPRFLPASLDLVGLIFLADLDIAARNIAINGQASLLDALILCPSLHRVQNAPFLSKGEYPACAAMTSGYVFRVENEATVLYLQRVSKTGHLTTLRVTDDSVSASPTKSRTALAYTIAATMSILTLIDMLRTGGSWLVLVLSLLYLSNLANVLIMQRRSTEWHGQSEPGVEGDLLVLLSQDRWIRIRGMVDDLKAVTSGQWIRNLSPMESYIVQTGTILLYVAAILAKNIDERGKWFILMQMVTTTILLTVANERTTVLRMNGRTVKVDGVPKQYIRRLDLAHEMIAEHDGRKDWAVRLGMVQGDNGADPPATM